MKSKEFVKLYKKITLIVFSLLTFLLLILINSNAYAAAVDMTLQKGKLNSSKYYHVEQRDLWKNENVYCIDPNRIVYEGDYKVSNSYEIDSKRGIYAANERQGIQAWILSNDGMLGYSRYDLATSTYEQYLKTSVGQHLMWMSMGSPCSRIPYKNFTYNGKTWKQWHYYDTNGNDQGYQGGTIIQEKNGVRAWGTLPCNVEDEWKKIVGDENDSENNPGYLNLLNYFRKRTNIEKKNSDKVKVEYDASKTVFKGASLSYESEEVFSNFDWEKNYIIIGPISFNAATGDWLKNIEIDYTKNGKKYYNQTPSKNNDDIKAFEKEKGYNGFDEVIKERLEDIQKSTVIHGYSGILDYGVIYGKNREPEIYLCVKKDVGITSIDNIKITVSRGEIKAWWYELKLSGQQTLLYGDGNVEFNNTSLRFESEALIPPVNLTLNKVNSLDLEGNELYNIPNIPFNIKFEQDGKEIYNKDVTTGKDGKIKIENVMPKNKNDITVTITEKKDIDGDGYKVLSEPLVITLQCSDDGTYWKEKDGAGKLAGGEKYVVNYNTNATIGLTVKLENKSIIEKLTLSKTSSVGGGKVEGAKFKLTLTNIASIKGYKIPTTGTPTIIVTTDKNGNIVLEDIEIADLSKDIVITVEETEAPVGYKKIEGKITVTLKRKGNTYTIHKAEKENTVTDDEFKAGEVTLINHELVLNIKDIPIMNLGGIVWTEKIKTGKEQPDINNTYSESDDEALGGVTVRLLDENDKTVATTKTAEKD
ncbi:MAG: prealbumin-like fold domain-containing protein, partial [Clostridia bacterium]